MSVGRSMDEYFVVYGCVCPFSLCLMDMLAVRAELSIVVQVDLSYGEISPLWRFREVLIIEGTLPKFPLLGECFI